MTVDRVPFLLTCVMVSAQASPMKLLCPACSHATAQRFLYSKNGCDILQCAECGLGRAQAGEFDPGTYYTADYFSGRHADGYADYRGAEPVLRREFANTVDFIRKHRPGGRLLDVGCAYGFFLQEAGRFFEVAGIEIAEDAAAYCREQGLRVSTGIADEANLAQLGMMDVIVLLDVVEHLPTPRETLSLCARYLAPGGVIVITTGDFASHYARLFGPRWRLMTPPQHLWYFTGESIRRISHSLGLSMETYDHPWKIVPISLIAFQIRRMLGMHAGGTSTPSGVGLPVNLFDAMRIVLRKSA
jgi:2-polyprenyl-3-methyl-5-hydroxy-6-metoxy-1,4-benzoquinol methylase